MTMKMWSLFSPVEILERLNQIFSEGRELVLWQHSTQQLFQLEGMFSEINENKCKLLLTGEYEEGSINDHEALYIHSPKENMIFKREKFSIVAGEVIFKTPSELMLNERRRIERFNFKYQDYKNVSFFYEGNNGIVKTNMGLINLSTAGLSFVGAQEQLNWFAEGHEIKITQITDQELENECSAKVIYVKKYTPKEGLSERSNVNDLLRVGVEFDKAIDEVSFQSVQSLVKRTQKRTKGLEVDGFNGLGEIEQMRVIRKVSEENPVLANQLIEHVQNLDKLRYLTTEMKRTFWLEVNQDLLATSLRLSSKELIYDLLSDVTETIRVEFLLKLNEPKSPSGIEKAARSICQFINKKEREGVLVLSAKSFVTYV